MRVIKTTKVSLHLLSSASITVNHEPRIRAEVTLPFCAVGLAGVLAASFNHGLSNGSTLYLYKTTATITSELSILTTKILNIKASHNTAQFENQITFVIKSTKMSTF